jgi:hypothetical protein
VVRVCGLCEQYGNGSDVRETIVFFVGFEVQIETIRKSSIFWDITSCGPLEVRALVAVNFTSVSSLTHSSTLKMEVTYSPEMTFNFKGLHNLIFQRT